jgi:hypothetical protein
MYREGYGVGLILRARPAKGDLMKRVEDYSIEAIGI